MKRIALLSLAALMAITFIVVALVAVGMSPQEPEIIKPVGWTL